MRRFGEIKEVRKEVRTESLLPDFIMDRMSTKEKFQMIVPKYKRNEQESLLPTFEDINSKPE